MMDVLEDRPELDAIAGHETHGALDGREIAQRRELIEQIENRLSQWGGLPGARAISVRLRVTMRRSQRE